MKKDIFTHIIAGKYKGKKLLLPSLDVTRSSKSILKESFFNRVQFDIIDSVFVEMFAGSGSMGLEAVSRGASKAIFVEMDRDSFKVLNQNIYSVDSSLCDSYLGDSFTIMPKILKDTQNSTDNPIYLYIDPPFDYRDGMESIYENSFEFVSKIESKSIALVTFEHLSSIKMPQKLGEFTLKKSKKFGKSSLSYYLADE
jgi:16S rRNA (guanine(966)-N(2))-methyltransferase RsmD